MKKKFLLLGSIATAAPILTFVSAMPNDDSYKKNDAYWFESKDFSQNYSNWMNELNDNLKMNQLSIPGTHDSGLWDGKGIEWFFGRNWARTQAYHFANQLKMGIRFFDIRIDENMNIKHGIVSSNGQTLESALDSFKKFLKKYPSEFIMIRIKDEGVKIEGNSTRWTKWGDKYLKTLQKFKDILFNNSKSTYDFSKLDTSVKNLRGKVFIFNNMHHLVSTSNYGGINWYSAFDPANVQDNYDTDINSKKRFISSMFQKSNADINKKGMYINFTSMADWKWIFQNAEVLNSYTLDFLRKNQQITELGIVPMDFPSASLSQMIWKTNFYYSKSDIEQKQIFGKIINPKSIKILEVDLDNKVARLNGATKNFEAEIWINNKKVQKIKLLNNNANINLNNLKINIGDKFEIKLYRLTPYNRFYKQESFNHINLSTIVNDHSKKEQIFGKYNDQLKTTNVLLTTLKSNKNNQYKNIINILKQEIINNESITINHLASEIEKAKNNLIKVQEKALKLKKTLDKEILNIKIQYKNLELATKKILEVMNDSYLEVSKKTLEISLKNNSKIISNKNSSLEDIKRAYNNLENAKNIARAKRRVLNLVKILKQNSYIEQPIIFQAINVLNNSSVSINDLNVIMRKLNTEINNLY